MYLTTIYLISTDWQEPEGYEHTPIPPDVRGTAQMHAITGKTNWQQPTKEQTEFCIRQLYLYPALVADITDRVSSS